MSQNALVSLVAKLPDVAVLCVGDVMLDRFVGGAVRRISPESPVPVLSMTETSVFAGGAANVAQNVAALGGRCTLVGVVGDDTAARDLAAALATREGIEPVLISAPDRPTSEKTRFVAQGQHMLRADNEVTRPVPGGIEDQLIAAVAERIGSHAVLLLSDYAKGVLTDRVVAESIALARAAGVPIVVDPKSSTFARYDGASILTPNAAEAQAATGLDPRDDAGATAAARRVLDTTSIGAVLVTRAERGMTLLARDTEPLHVPSRARQVADVVGAGDTVIATLALAIGAGGSLAEAAALANAAAGIVVGKRGTATVSRGELIAELEAAYGRGAVSTAIKVQDRRLARDMAAAWRREGLRVGFTNGCFDLLHAGHIAIIEFARAQCDRLIVGVNADASVRRLKGPSRPVNSEQDRARLLAALAAVDGVVVFDEDTPAELIAELTPHVLVKGSDYQIEQIVGADTVLAHGGQVLRFDLIAGHSTTSTIARIGAETA